MSNPFKILIVLALLIAVVLAAGFTYIVFLKEPGKISRSLSSHSVIESA